MCDRRRRVQTYREFVERDRILPSPSYQDEKFRSIYVPPAYGKKKAQFHLMVDCQYIKKIFK